MSFIVHKTRGIFLQGCSISRIRLLQVDTSSQILDNWSFRRRIVAQTPSCVWEIERLTTSSSRKYGMIISSNTGNLQGELMEKRFSSYCRCFVAKRTISCAKSVSGFEEAKEKIDTLLLQKPASRNLPSTSYFHGNDERSSDFFIGTERRQCAISARRGKKCSSLREVQGRILHVCWSPGSEETWNFEKAPRQPKRTVG